VFRLRAGNRCEYCRLPASLEWLHFQIDHIIAQKHLGATATKGQTWKHDSARFSAVVEIASRPMYVWTAVGPLAATVYLMVLGALALLAFRPGSAGGPGRLLFDPPRPLPVE
jgi:hypothetical protein